MNVQDAVDACFVAVKGYVDRSLVTFGKRLGDLETRAPASGAPGKDGRDGVDGKDGEPGADGKDGADGRDGKDAGPVTREQIIEAILAMPDVIGEAVARYLEDNPPVAGKDGRDGVDGKDGEPGQKGLDGRDGVSLAGAMIDRDGGLIVTLSNGEHKSLGSVVGRDGRDGNDGKDGIAGAPGKNGADGTNGADGVGFDDLDLIENEQGVVLRFLRGSEIKEFPLPVVVDRGVWTDKLYRKGSGVTWAGSFWIAQRDTDVKPDTPDGGWRLAVKRGRDGKDGKSGASGK